MTTAREMDNEIDWSSLTFDYTPADINLRCHYSDGKWGEIEATRSQEVALPIAATCLQYGQEVFEGLKIFCGKDGKVRAFRMADNARRIKESAEALIMEPVPEEMFCEMVKKIVKLNARFIPPYGTGASLYIRPLQLGISPQIAVRHSTEFVFIMMASPVGPYFREGFCPTPICVTRRFDRVAPCGTGRWKVGGNYAYSLTAGKMAHDLGYSSVLYLDPREKRFLDECGPANFFAIKGNTYITPKSDSILPSITNMSFMQIARDMGLTVEQRQILLDELDEVDEAAACGTAAVASPISRIDDLDTGRSFVISPDNTPGPITTELYHRLRAIQYGEAADIHGWTTVIDLD